MKEKIAGEEGGREKIVITIGGLPGSGTTTTAELLSAELGVPWTNGGKIFRELASEKGMSLSQFGTHAEENAEVDRELDKRLIEIMRNGNIILESRLAGANADAHGIESLRVWLHASLDVRAQRIHVREGGGQEKQTQETKERERSERARYMEYYGIDYEDFDHYSVVINSGEYLPDQIVRIILVTLSMKE